MPFSPGSPPHPSLVDSDLFITEEARRESEAFLRSVLAAAADCIKVLDLDGRLQWMSENGRCIMDIEDFAAVRGMDWFSFWRAEATRNQARDAFAAALRGELGRFQGLCPTLRQTPKWWDVVLSSIRGPDGAVHSVLAVSRDITELKRTEEAAKISEATVNRQLRMEIAERRKVEAGRQELIQQLAGAEEAERCRISRELHDQVGQHMTSLLLGLQSLRPHVGAMDETLRQLESTTELVGQEIHALALELRPTALDDLGLSQALAQYLEAWSARTGVAVQFKRAQPGEERFPAPIETAIYRLVREALTNVAKHARARRVAVAVERCVNHLLAIVEDDGQGFDAESLAGDPNPSRLGVPGMRERMNNCGGTFHLESKRGEGTTVVARIPLPAAKAGDA